MKIIRTNLIMSAEIDEGVVSQPSLKSIFESLMFGFIETSQCYHSANIPIGDGFILNEEKDKLLIGESLNYFDENTFEHYKSNDYNISGIILTESKLPDGRYYSSEFNDNMTVEQLDKIVKFLAKFGKKSVDLLFDYNAYRINSQLASAYDKIKNNQSIKDHFRLSDHWNITDKQMGMTEDGITDTNSVRIGQWNGNNWTILKEIGKKQPCSEKEIKEAILKSNIFSNNEKCLEYLEK